MKVSAAGLKNFDWKSLLVNHGEKLILGGVILFGLAIVATSRWATFQKDPQEFITQAETSKAQYFKSTWPEEEKTKYSTTRDISGDAQKLLSSLNEQKFAFTGSLNELYWPVIPPQKPAEEPQWYPVQDLVASSGSGIFAVAPPIDETLVGTEGSTDALAAAETPKGPTPGGLDDVLPNAKRMQAGMGGEGETGLPFGMSEFGSDTGMTSEMGPGMMGEMGESGMTAPAYQGEPRRYVAVRGIFPLKREMQELERALNLGSITEASQALVFTDFELERQRAVSGPNPWTGSWEPVDVEVALDMLNKTSVDIDEVNPAVTDSVFTMPLPARVPGVGTWGDKATHPALSEYLLTEDAKKKQEWLMEKLAEFAKRQEDLQKVMVAQRGFSSTVYNARTTLGAAAESGEMMGRLSTAATQGTKGLNVTPEDIKKMVNASGSYLLFRYIDFDIAPGNAYRYRVRLQLANPNANRPLDEIARPDVAQGLYRWTPWSQPSGVVIVPEDTLAFVTDIRHTTPRLPDTARFEIFEWSSKYGTYANGGVTVAPGQFVGGTQTVDVLDPAGQTFEQKPYTFTTPMVLVDTEVPPITLLTNVASELNLPKRVDIPKQVLLVNQFGELEVRDPISRAAEHARWIQRQKIVAEAYDFLKKKAQMTEEMMGMEGEMGSGEMGMGEMGMGMEGPRRRNPLRKRGRAAAGSGSETMMNP